MCSGKTLGKILKLSKEFSNFIYDTYLTESSIAREDFNHECILITLERLNSKENQPVTQSELKRYRNIAQKVLNEDELLVPISDYHIFYATSPALQYFELIESMGLPTEERYVCNLLSKGYDFDETKIKLYFL